MNLILRDIFRKSVGTFLTIFIIVFSFTLIPISAFVFNTITEDFLYNAKISSLNLSSTVYVTDENGVTKEYTKAYTNENRIWVDFKNIPKHMKDAMVAIEDKRFYSHSGIDFKRLFGAVFSILSRGRVFGGSTLTQQLIKNITGENEVSITRKFKEIIRALNFERKYSKDEILELYLNIVNFGSGCYGVQTAANLYFNKDISKCSIAECAAIAGITQNPCGYNPLANPKNNKERREIVINEMFSQGKITKNEYDKAMQESNNMAFKRKKSNKKQENVHIHDWYTEVLFNDVINDLSIKYKISRDVAEKMLYTQGLKIYSAMDLTAQNIAQKVICESSLLSGDKKLEIGFFMMDGNGKVLASIGSRNKKTANRILDRATLTKRQPGSAFKPLSVYAPSIDLGLINYSSFVNDSPIENYYGQGRSGPNNWYKSYKGDILLPYAIQQSANAPVANLLLKLTNRNSYNFLTRYLNFGSLDKVDLVSSPALALGGLHKGVTVREMASAFNIFCNGGVYNKPYTYSYVLDNAGKVILDNRHNVGKRVIKPSTSYIMNRLLREVVTSGTGRAANIGNVEVIGKTGTTDNHKDSWFVGATPYGVIAVWTGYDAPAPISSTSYSKSVFREVMSQYVNRKGNVNKQFSVMPESVIKKNYCKETGKLAIDSYCPVGGTGYYSIENTPEYCTKHKGSSHKMQPELGVKNGSDDFENNEEDIDSESTADE